MESKQAREEFNLLSNRRNAHKSAVRLIAEAEVALQVLASTFDRNDDVHALAAERVNEIEGEIETLRESLEALELCQKVESN
jgi:hypothetical protein